MKTGDKIFKDIDSSVGDLLQNDNVLVEEPETPPADAYHNLSDISDGLSDMLSDTPKKVKNKLDL